VTLQGGDTGSQLFASVLGLATILGPWILNLVWNEVKRLREFRHWVKGETKGLRGWMLLIARQQGIQLPEYRENGDNE